MSFNPTPVPGENEIECARCGAVFYYELLRCPNCGVYLYEPDDEDDQRETKPFKPHPAGLSARIGNFFRRLMGQPHPAEELFNQSLRQAALQNDLLKKVGGDRETAERLIEFERQRLPNATRLTWLQNAIQRWEKDND
jgi:predicted  nucleic acid-binding Zn-ribbon protein